MTALWICFHGVTAASFFLGLFFSHGINIDSDIYSMMPSTKQSAAIKIAENSVSKNSSRTVFMLVSHPDFQQAKASALQAFSLLSENQKFAFLSLNQDFSSSKEIKNFLSENRYRLLSEEIREELSTKDGPASFCEDALAKAYGGFSVSALDNLEEDPFLLDEANLMNFLSVISDSGTAMQPKDGVLASKFQDKWYVMIRGELTAEGAKLASSSNAVPEIYRICAPLEQNGVKFVFYGTPFHSYKSSVSASREISIISTASMLAVLVILLVVFRSGLPIFCSLFSILLSVLTGFFATHAIFSNLHMITLVFGTSLIGSSIDYSLHFFINWKAGKTFKSGQKIRNHIFSALILSLISTEICYILLSGAPFQLLKQMAVFSLTGILSSFLTATGLFPLLKLPPEEKRTIPLYNRLLQIQFFRNKTFSSFFRFIPFAVLAASVVIISFNHETAGIKNNVSSLYKMKGRLKEDTILAYQVLNYNPSSYLILSADSQEELLQKEERISSMLPDTFISTSRIIPSIKVQKESLQAAEKLVPFAEYQFENLGMAEIDAENFRTKFYQIKSASDFLTPSSKLPENLHSLLDMLWIGKIQDKFYSIILPSEISDEAFYKRLSESEPEVFFQNKVKDISESLDQLTKLIAVMFGMAFLVIVIIMKCFYDWKSTIKIASIPVLSVLVIISVFTASGLKIEFFCITGIILVFGLGLDYVIYRLENKNNPLETFAITLSFVTTAVSFGALALSSFVPVHVLGLSIFSGLVTAFICALI